jgi:hypothetical protein
VRLPLTGVHAAVVDADLGVSTIVGQHPDSHVRPRRTEKVLLLDEDLAGHWEVLAHDATSPFAII